MEVKIKIHTTCNEFLYLLKKEQSYEIFVNNIVECDGLSQLEIPTYFHN